MRQFAETYIVPLLQTYIPLDMSDEAFEQLKGIEALSGPNLELISIFPII